MKEYNEDSVALCVQQVFGNPTGRLVLEWLEDLFLRHSVKPLIDGGVTNLPERLAFDAGCRHVVVTLRHVFEHGFEHPQPQPTEEEF